MNITCTGKQEHLHPDQETSLKTKIAKISKLIEGNGHGGKKAHFILDQHKNQFHAEITLNYLDHSLVGEHSDSEQFAAISVALDKLEKQLLKVRDKR
ncbi:MAG: ribosome-associated translation inhibitor RaiA, partial [Bryobacteraceae bacterium]